MDILQKLQNVQCAGIYVCNNSKRPGPSLNGRPTMYALNWMMMLLLSNSWALLKAITNGNCVKIVRMERLKDFVAAINVEPAWVLYFVGIGMFYMPSQVPISQTLNDSLYLHLSIQRSSIWRRLAKWIWTTPLESVTTWRITRQSRLRFKRKWQEFRWSKILW